MVLTIFDSFYNIQNMDGKKTWYKASEEDVNQLKDVFDQAAKEMQEEIGEKQQDSEKETEEPSHSSEIEEESDVSALDEEE